MEEATWKLIKQEPVAAQGLLQAVISLAIAFGWTLTPERMGSILAVTAAALAFWTRTQVTPLSNPKNSKGASLVSK